MNLHYDFVSFFFNFFFSFILFFSFFHLVILTNAGKGMANNTAYSFFSPFLQLEQTLRRNRTNGAKRKNDSKKIVTHAHNFYDFAILQSQGLRVVCEREPITFLRILVYIKKQEYEIFAFEPNDNRRMKESTRDNTKKTERNEIELLSRGRRRRRRHFAGLLRMFNRKTATVCAFYIHSFFFLGREAHLLGYERTSSFCCGSPKCAAFPSFTATISL